MRPTMVSGSGSGTSLESFRHTDAAGGITAWYSPLAVARSAANQSLAANTLLAMPFSANRVGTIDAIACRVVGLSGAGNRVGRLGIYRGDSFTNLYPTALIAEATTTFTTSAAAWKQLTITASVETKYPYFLAMVLDHTGANPTFWGPAVGGWNATLGVRNASAAVFYVGWTVAFAYAALPATFPGGGTRATTTQPMIFVRYAT